MSRALATMLPPVLLLALAPIVAAAVDFDGNVPPNLSIGQSITIKWKSDSKPVKVTLVGGDNYSLIDVVCGAWINNDLTKACTSGKSDLTWTPDASVPEGRYTFLATDASGKTDTSNFITISKGNGLPTTTSPGGGTGVVSSTFSSTGMSISTTTPVAPSGTAQATSSSSSGSSLPAAPVSDQSGGLSSGATAGVGVGAAIGGIALLAGLGFLVFRLGKKAAANKEKANDDGGEGGDAGAGGKVGGAAALAAAAAAKEDEKKEKNKGPAEMPAPDVVHEAPDYRHLDSPGTKHFFSELDATGGSFVLPPSRPSSPGNSEAGRPITPQITVSPPGTESTSTRPFPESPDAVGATLSSSEGSTAVGSPDRLEEEAGTAKKK